MSLLSKRASDFGTTIFTEMSALATKTGAINLGQGFPDHDGPLEVAEAAIAAIQSGRNQYPPGRGFPEFCEAVASHQRHWYGLELNPATDVVATTGASEALFASVFATVNPGDEVVVFAPYFDIYVPAIRWAGATHRTVTLTAPDFRITADAIRAAVTDRTRAIIFNSPHNPTGRVFDSSELQAIADVAIEQDLVVISDEVYEHLVFDNARHTPIATLPGMFERTITISSMGKSFAFTGWKVGWASGPEPLMSGLLGIKQFVTFASGAPLQLGAAAALALPDSYFSDYAAWLQARRNQLVAGLDAAGFGLVQPQGTYFVTTDVRPLGFNDGLDFCQKLPELAGLVAIPLETLYDRKPGEESAGKALVRWAFCKQESVLTEAVERLGQLAR